MSMNKRYNGLYFKTKRGASPQGCPRVYFCSHEQDFLRYFEMISDEILAIQTNAAVWYYDPNENIPNGEDFFADLSQMQLFVIPVTENFVYQDCQARMTEFVYAIKHHIPVLPLMQESGLDNDFSQRCGELQFLDKSIHDPTAIPYQEKLKSFLQSVLNSDDMIKKIRASFDAYIFLSYRKKNRRYAKQIMQLIHSYDFCRDIAIWYDEFLLPGENFNNAIATALKKCDIFTLVITPDLVNELNYVVTTEYPMAVENGKPVLPIEAVATVPEKPTRIFRNIPARIPAENEQAVGKRLRELLCGKTLLKNDGDAQHLFFIGLAYLGGVDVEVNHKRAQALITSAAEQGLHEAYEKLVCMYRTGEGVERNYYTAIEWQKKYVEKLRQDAHITQNASEYICLLNAIGKLNEYYFELLDWDAINENCLQMEHYALELAKLGKPRTFWHISASYNRLGRVSLMKHNLAAAKKYYEWAMDIIEMLTQDSGTSEEFLDLSNTYEGMGDVLFAEGKLSDARRYYKSALSIHESLAKDIGVSDERRNLSVLYSKLGDISLTEQDLSAAKEYYVKAHRIFEALVKETDTIEARRDLSISFNNLGDVGQFDDKKLYISEFFYKRGLEICEALAEEDNTMDSYRTLSISYKKLGEISYKQENIIAAIDYYKKGVAITEMLSNRLHTPQSFDEYAISLYKLWLVEQEGTARLEQAVQIYEELCRQYPDVKRYRKNLDIMHKDLQLFRYLNGLFEEN